MDKKRAKQHINIRMKTEGQYPSISKMKYGIQVPLFSAEYYLGTSVRLIPGP